MLSVTDKVRSSNPTAETVIIAGRFVENEKLPSSPLAAPIPLSNTIFASAIGLPSESVIEPVT